MLAERAIFTSGQSRDVRGYHLVARSPGIDDELAQRLSVSAPSHDSLEGTDLSASSWNYCLVNDWAVVSRTAYGGPEYSDRGSFRIVTMFLAVPQAALSGYDNRPYLLTRVAHALGLLSVPFPIASELNTVELPDTSIMSGYPSQVTEPVDGALLKQLAVALADSRPIVVHGVRHPEAAVQRLYSFISGDMRPWISYSTRLKPSINRPFRLQFCAPCDPRRVSALESRGFRCMHGT